MSFHLQNDVVCIMYYALQAIISHFVSGVVSIYQTRPSIPPLCKYQICISIHAPQKRKKLLCMRMFLLRFINNRKRGIVQNIKKENNGKVLCIPPENAVVYAVNKKNKAQSSIGRGGELSDRES